MRRFHLPRKSNYHRTSANLLRYKSDIYGSIITAIVRPDCKKKDYQIHEGLLRHYTSYFRTALKPVWADGKRDTITLPDDNPTLFKIFFHWLYSGKLYSNLASDGSVPISESDLCVLFVFGDCRGIPGLCNAAVDLLFQCFAGEWRYANGCLNYIYDNTSTESALLAIFVDLAVGTFSFPQFRACENIYPKEFLIDVISRSRELKSWPGNLENKKKFLDKKAAEMCMYHGHKDPYIM